MCDVSIMQDDSSTVVTVFFDVPVYTKFSYKN